jgi:hypothetical protein
LPTTPIARRFQSRPGSPYGKLGNDLQRAYPDTSAMKSVHWQGAAALFGLAAAVALSPAQGPVTKNTTNEIKSTVKKTSEKTADNKTIETTEQTRTESTVERGPEKAPTPPKKQPDAPPVEVEQVLLRQDAKGTATFRLGIRPDPAAKNAVTIDVRSLLGETMVGARLADPAKGSVEATLAKPVKSDDLTSVLTVLGDLKTKTITVALADGTTQTGIVKDVKPATSDIPLGQIIVTVKDGDTASDATLKLADIVSLTFRQDAASFDLFLRRAASNVGQITVRSTELAKVKLDVTVELGGAPWGSRYEADMTGGDLRVFLRIENRTALAWTDARVLASLGTPLDDSPFDGTADNDARIVIVDKVSVGAGTSTEVSVNAKKDLGVAKVQSFFVADGTKTGTLKYGVEIRGRNKWLGPGLVLIKEKGQLRARQDGFKGALHLEGKPLNLDVSSAVSTLGSQWDLKEKSDVTWVGGLSDGTLQIAYAYTTTVVVTPDASLPSPPTYFYRETAGREIASDVVRVRDQTCTLLRTGKTTVQDSDSDPQNVDITKWSAADLKTLLTSMDALDPDEGIAYGDATYILGQLLEMRRSFEAAEQQYKQALADNAKKQDRIIRGNPAGGRRAVTEQQRQRLEASDHHFDRLSTEEADLNDQLATLVGRYDRYVRSLRIPIPIEIVSP